ncbi:hypothetical protein Taro_000181 [Colocasia esculenta]|uniref:Aminotransferase-like plant mobile domain-containing protein n=1 Tax=Colocasia esculenta TaxID=4460 RepID=A0A843T694_COLES|nr:hypothetical protein [Colocasia esculenta]
MSEPGPQADLDMHRFLVLFLGRLLFATRGDAVHCHFLPLLEDLGEVGGYAWGAAFLAHQFDGLSASERQMSTSGFYPFLQVWAYLHLPVLGRGDLTRPGPVPIARRWDSRRDTRHLADQLERLQEAIDSYPYLDVVWQPYLGEGDEGQPWLAQARPYFGRVSWSSPSGTASVGRVGAFGDFTTRQTGVSERESRLRTGSARARRSSQTRPLTTPISRVDVTGKIASLRALLHSAMLDREAAQSGVSWRDEGCRSRRCLLLSECRGLSIASRGPTGKGSAESRGGSEAPGGTDSGDDEGAGDAAGAEAAWRPGGGHSTACRAVGTADTGAEPSVDRDEHRPFTQSEPERRERQQGDRRLRWTVLSGFLQKAEERGGGEAPAGRG